MKWIKYIGLTILVVLILIAGFAYNAISSTETRIAQNYSIHPKALFIDTSAVAIERGKHQSYIRGCVECHGGDFSGKTIVEAPEVGQFIGSNITGGKGSPVANYSVEDWVRTIRYGVKPDGKPLIFMPSDEFTGISEQDLSDLLSYLKSIPVIDNDPGKTEVSPIFKFIAHVDRTVKILPAELVNHEAIIPTHLEPERSVAYGKYLAVTCTGCHGSGFKGGKIPGVPPDWPEAANLTKTGVLPKISQEKFHEILKTGINSDGRELNPTFMPYPIFKEFTDLEMDAIYLYLSSL